MDKLNENSEIPFRTRILVMYARMVKLVDTLDLKSRGQLNVRTGSIPAPGTKYIN